MLSARGLRPTVAPSGLAALRAVALDEPQLVFVDLGLPDFDGVELCRRIRSLVVCPIIVVTADRDEARMVEALDLGADDYITKPYSTELLMARVRVALRRAAELAATATRTTFCVGDLVVDVGAHLATAGGAPIELSPRQFRLLTAFVRNAGLVLTHHQLGMIASADRSDPWGSDGLRGAVSHLRKRLGSGPARPRIVTEPHVGYRLLPPD